MNCRDNPRFAGGDSVYYKPPPGVVERIETNAIRVFPCAVALLFVPTLKPDQFIHGVFFSTFWAACISAAVAARVVCGPRLTFPRNTGTGIRGPEYGDSIHIHLNYETHLLLLRDSIPCAFAARCASRNRPSQYPFKPFDKIFRTQRAARALRSAERRIVFPLILVQ